MKVAVSVVLSLLCVLASAKVQFEERFDGPAPLGKRWIVPTAPLKNKDGQEIPLGKWEVSEGSLKTTEDSRFYEISSKLDHPFSNEGKDLVVQFTVKYPEQVDCAGGYLKLFGRNVEQERLSGETPYLLMFGPDICGHSRRIHVIWSHKGENFLIKKTIPTPPEALTHLYTLVVRPDQSYEVLVDQEKVAEGSLAEDWEILPPKKISDPKAVKPSDWVDERQIDDPEDKKPKDWDDELDGEWKAPVKENPDYKGEWAPRRIPNPAYKGEWVAPLVDNPEYYTDDKLYILKDIGAVGFDLWTVKSGSRFDNILVTDSAAYAKSMAEETWRPLYEQEKKATEKGSGPNDVDGSDDSSDDQDQPQDTDRSEGDRREEL